MSIIFNKLTIELKIHPGRDAEVISKKINSLKMTELTRLNMSKIPEATGSAYKTGGFQQSPRDSVTYTPRKENGGGKIEANYFSMAKPSFDAQQQQSPRQGRFLSQTAEGNSRIANSTNSASVRQSPRQNGHNLGIGANQPQKAIHHEALGSWMNTQTTPLMRNREPQAFATMGRDIGNNDSNFGSRNRSVQVVSTLSHHTDRTVGGGLKKNGRNILGRGVLDDVSARSSIATSLPPMQKNKGKSGKSNSLTLFCPASK